MWIAVQWGRIVTHRLEWSRIVTHRLEWSRIVTHRLGVWRQGHEGTMGGWIRFVPGSIRQPTGAPFQVAVPTFKLSFPDFIY